VRIDDELYAVVLAGPAHRFEGGLKAYAAALLRTCRAIEALR
jgi:hypothetical protein